MAKPKHLTVPIAEVIADDLRDDEFVVAYLNGCLNEPDPAVFLMALRQVAKARPLLLVIQSKPDQRQPYNLF